MTYKEIQELIRLVMKSDLAQVKINIGDVKVDIKTKHYMDGKSLPAQVYSSSHIQPTFESIHATPQDFQRNSSDSSESSAPTANSGLKEVRSPMVGTFYRSPGPDKPVFVKPGDKVSSGSVVCIIEAMKLFNEIESDISGTIVKIMVEDASPVEYNQVLFLVEE